MRAQDKTIQDQSKKHVLVGDLYKRMIADETDQFLVYVNKILKSSNTKYNKLEIRTLLSECFNAYFGITDKNEAESLIPSNLYRESEDIYIISSYHIYLDNYIKLNIRDLLGFTFEEYLDIPMGLLNIINKKAEEIIIDKNKTLNKTITEKETEKMLKEM